MFQSYDYANSPIFMEGHTRKYDTQYIGVLSNSGVTVLTRRNSVD